MATRYVGIGGSDANNGSSYALRKLTLSAIEAIPVAAGDIVYVAPGVYRETLTIGVSGTAGNPITYIADVDGSHTDGIGGVVRITGSDNDQTATRGNCITATSKDYRTFRGFAIDHASGLLVSLITACNNWIMEDCYFTGASGAAIFHINVAGTGTNHIIRRCIFFGGRGDAIFFTHTAAVDNAGHLVENCLFVALGTIAFRIDKVGGITVKNCTFLGCNTAIRVAASLTTGQTTTVKDCLFAYSTTALQAATAPGTNEEITENYNALFGSSTDRSNVSTGANSNAFPPLFVPPIMLAGLRYPWNPFDLSQWSPLRALAGLNMSSDGLHGMARPVTDSKKSWGAIQYNDVSREVTTKRTGAASLKLADAGRMQMFVPTTAVSTTFSCYVRWEANYAGTKPQMIIHQPGQSDVTVTAVGSSGAWELLTTTLTPAASPGYCVVEFKSSNTASGASIATYFDDVVPNPAGATGGFETFRTAQQPFDVLAAAGGVGASIFGGELVR